MFQIGRFLFCRKISAAKHRIALYHQQLLEGCGNKDCSNKYCASSPQFCYKDLDSNSAAAMAIELLSKHAPLCKTIHKVEVKDTVEQADTASQSLPVEKVAAKNQACSSASADSSCSVSVQSPAVSPSWGVTGAGAAKSDSLGKANFIHQSNVFMIRVC